MAFFNPIYCRLMLWSQHRHAPRYLAGLSFAESSLIPVPPDLMLIPMILARVDQAWRYAFITTFASILGGILGYCLGYFFIELIEPVLRQSHYWQAYQTTLLWVQDKGVILIMMAGILPVPYKLFTLGAGALQIPFIPFLLASIVGRTLRYYVVSGLVVWKGERVRLFLHNYIERLGWLMIGLASLGLLVSHFTRS